MLDSVTLDQLRSFSDDILNHFVAPGIEPVPQVDV